MISVVIPVKDDATALRRCLAALRAQTRVPDEIVVVDNASTDASARVAADGGARVIPCADPGIPAAAACGYDAAQGALILRLDADCVPAPDWIDTIERAFARAPGVDAYTGAATFVDGPRALRRAAAAAYLGAYMAIGSLALGHPPLFGSNLAFRRCAWERVSHEVHRADAELHDDLDLSFHFGEEHRIGIVPARTMAISMRPLSYRAGFARRVARGFRTVFAHWPHQFPPFRWRRRALMLVRRRSRPRIPVGP